MPIPKPHIAWLPILQLLLGCGLLATGSQQLVGQRLSEHAARRPAVHTVTSQPAIPAPIPYTFPGGGRQLFPHYRLAALYGSPGAPILGALGQQDLAKSISRVKKLAAAYQPYSQQPILPTFEIIATVASVNPTDDNDYSREVSPAVLQSWITAARQHGIYVVLDLQSGRTDFLTQAKRLKPLLIQPNVGLALDPEWRLTSTQVPLKQIGHVSIREVNQTAAWLAQLTNRNQLPQKLFLLHQFRVDMLPGRQQLDSTYTDLAFAVQMDGQGTQGQKQDTWHNILLNPPANSHFGWKNFYQKDATLLTPKQTMAIRPQPWYVSYQ